MVRGSRVVLKSLGEGISKTLNEILVCPLTKQPLRYCEKTGSLISDQIGVSFPFDVVVALFVIPFPGIMGRTQPNLAAVARIKIVDGIPRLVPKDGKILEDDESSATGKSSATKNQIN